MDLKEILGGFVIFIIGVVILIKIVEALNISFGIVIIAAFGVAGIIWFLKEVVGI